jgi:hypothetical protein
MNVFLTFKELLDRVDPLVDWDAADERVGGNATCNALTVTEGINALPGHLVEIAESIVEADHATGLYKTALCYHVMMMAGSCSSIVSALGHRTIEVDDLLPDHRCFTEEEDESDLPELLLKYCGEYLDSRGTEYVDGYDMTYSFGIDEDGYSSDRVTVRYYY